MKKWMTKKNGIVLILLFIFTMGVMTFQKPVYDVEITINTADKSNKGYVVQLFWDDGTGYTAENSTLAEIVGGAGTLFLPKDIVESIVAYRLDPIHGEQDIVYESIYVNGTELLASNFWSYMKATEQTEIYLEDAAYGEGKQLRFDVYGNDSQVYLNDAFEEYILKATKLSIEEKATMISVGAVIAFVLIFYKEIWQVILYLFVKGEALSVNVVKIHPRWRLVIVITAIALISLIVMNQYIFGDKRFLFVDAGDSYYQTYPGLLNIARYVEKGLIYDSFNFSQGLGQAQGAIKLDLTNWVAWFGEDAIAYLMGVSQLLKIFFSGTFFYGFMRVKGVERWYSMILALGYAFCGHMAVRSSWASYPNEVLLVAIWLFAFECWFQKKDLRWLPIATFLLFYHYGSGYYFILYILFLPAYILFRYFTERRVNGKIIGIALGGFAALIIAYLYITDFSTVKQVLDVLQTDRVQEVVEKTDWSLNSFALDIDLLPRIFGRTIGLSVLGIIRNNYVEDYWNFLEDPTFFCGIVTLILIPLAFYVMDVKKRICYSLLYIVASVYCLCEPLRIIVNGFSGVTYKQSSFWIILVMLFMVSQINFEKIKEKGIEKKCFYILSMTVVLLVSATLYLPNLIEISILEYRISVFFIILEYIGLSFLLLRNDITHFMKITLVFVACIETICVSYPVYNNRNTADGTSYKDDTMLALEYLEECEGDSFYRIDKQYIIGHACDALAQNYYGTAAYIGGTGIASRLALFYNELGLPIYGSNKMAFGMSGYNDTQNLLGIKYALTKLNLVGHYGYTKVGQTGDVNIYENKYSMPMGFVYQYAIERSTFETLTNKQRQQILLEACLVEDGNITLPLIDEERIASLNRSEQLFEQYEIPFESAENYSYVFEPVTEEEVVCVQIAYTNSGSGYLYYQTEDGETGAMLIDRRKELNGQIFEIAVSGVNRIWSNAINIEELRIAKIPKNEYYARFEENMEELQKSSVQVSYYTDNLIEGTFFAEQAGMLFLPIESSNWQVYIDDEWQNKQIINDAFIGVYVEPGQHILKAFYPTGTFKGTYGSDIKNILACILIAIIGSIWMHMKRKRGLKHEGNISSSTSI